MMVTPNSGCSINKGAAIATEHQNQLEKKLQSNWQPTMMTLAMTTVSSNSSPISNTAVMGTPKAVTARAVAAA